MQPLQIHLLSFEGPDRYARAGGIASRVTGLSRGLADLGLPTHLWFVGDPELPGHERSGELELHRWCQWISQHHPHGVYDGEEGKRADYAASLPPYLIEHQLVPHLARGGIAAVLAEEWHTADAVVHLDALLRQHGLRDRVAVMWNANNTFGFDRIDWPSLERAATLTTVSRYMKHLMWGLGVDPLVIPNGIEPEALAPPEPEGVRALRQRFEGRTLLAKIARWDPDKRWLLAIDTVGRLKARGERPLLVARGGMEAHEAEVLQRAQEHGLRVVERAADGQGTAGLVRALTDLDAADVVVLRSFVDPDSRRTLFRSAHAVLANSGREPFGLVGLEAMAAAGVACTGCSGEDYAVSGENALVLETNDPTEFVSLFDRLRADPAREHALRRAGRSTARKYSWTRVIEQRLLPRLPHVSTPRAA